MVALTEPALDDLRRAGPVAAALLLGRLRVLEQEPEAGRPLVDRRTGFRVLDALDGDARIVYGHDGESNTKKSGTSRRQEHGHVLLKNIAAKWQITRQEQDAFATSSQNKAEDAQKAGRFKDEIIPVTVKTRKGDVVVDQDEYIRPGTTLDALAKLKPAFNKEGTVTAGNASGLNDGAAALVLMSADEARSAASRRSRRSSPGRPRASIRR